MMYHDLDSELIRAWQLLHELAESNARNRELASGLHGVADTLKVNYTLFVHTAFRKVALSRANPRKCPQGLR